MSVSVLCKKFFFSATIIIICIFFSVSDVLSAVPKPLTKAEQPEKDVVGKIPNYSFMANIFRGHVEPTEVWVFEITLKQLCQINSEISITDFPVSVSYHRRTKRDSGHGHRSIEQIFFGKKSRSDEEKYTNASAFFNIFPYSLSFYALHDM